MWLLHTGKTCKQHAARTKECICEHTQVFTTLKRCQDLTICETCDINESHGVHHFIVIDRVLLLLVRKPSLAVAHCRMCCCVSFVPLSQVALHNYAIVLGNLRAQMHFLNTSPLFLYSWVIDAILCSTPQWNRNFDVDVDGKWCNWPAVAEITSVIATKNWMQPESRIHHFVSRWGATAGHRNSYIDMISRTWARCS